MAVCLIKKTYSRGKGLYRNALNTSISVNFIGLLVFSNIVLLVLINWRRFGNTVDSRSGVI